MKDEETFGAWTVTQGVAVQFVKENIDGAHAYCSKDKLSVLLREDYESLDPVYVEELREIYGYELDGVYKADSDTPFFAEVLFAPIEGHEAHRTPLGELLEKLENGPITRLRRLRGQ